MKATNGGELDRRNRLVHIKKQQGGFAEENESRTKVKKVGEQGKTYVAHKGEGEIRGGRKGIGAGGQF